MNEKRKLYLIIGVVILFLMILLIVKCVSEIRKELPRNYKEIRKEGILKVTCEYSNSSFRMEGDSTMGFYYELAKIFAESKHLKIEVIPENSLEKQKALLKNDMCDIIITGIMVTSESKDSSINYTTPILLDKQVLVQRKKESVHDTGFVSSQLQLAKKVLYVPEHSNVINRIHNLMQEIGDTIYVKELKKYNSEQLMAMVAHKDIDYAVCSRNTGQAATKYYPQLDMNTDISFNQFYSWGVSGKQKELLSALNQWIAQFKKTKKYKELINKYYK